MRHTKDKTGKNKRSFFIFAIVFEIMFYYGNILNAKETSSNQHFLSNLLCLCYYYNRIILSLLDIVNSQYTVTLIM